MNDIYLQIPVDPDRVARIWNRNGCPILIDVIVEQLPTEVWLYGHNRRGQPVEKSGLRMLPEEMDRVALEWLLARGWTVTIPQESETDAEAL